MRHLVAVFVAALVVGACLAPRPPEPSAPRVSPSPPLPSAPRPSAADLAIATGRPSPTASPTPTPAPVDERCEPLTFDESAVLDPIFREELFLRGEAETITGRVVRELSVLYGGGRNVDRCDLFTDRGLATALLFDTRLAAIDRGQIAIDADLVLRVALERSSYDLRIHPPRVPVDAVYDLPAGSRVRDAATGVVTETADVERIGLGLVLAFDGHRWRVDEVGPVSPDNLEWTIAPAPLPPGEPCHDVRHDPAGAAYDDRAGRPWCTEHGTGTLLRPDQEYALLTRYPCGGKASILTLPAVLGDPIDWLDRREYVRDPNGSFRDQGWLAARYNGATLVPADAFDTGWTNGNVDLWISPSNLERGIYLVRGTVVERWARAADSWGVIDCN